MSVFHLTREQLQALMMRLHRVDADRRIAMMGRLKHLQRLGWPPGSNTGKGKRVKYTADQVVQVGLALEMIQLGLTPEITVSTLETNTDFIWPVVRISAAQGTMSTPSLLMFDPAALSVALDSSRPDGDERPLKGDNLDQWVRRRRRGAVVNVTNLVADMSKQLADLGFSKHGDLELGLTDRRPTEPRKTVER